MGRGCRTLSAPEIGLGEWGRDNGFPAFEPSFQAMNGARFFTLLADCRYLCIMSYLGIVFRKNTPLGVVKRDLQLLLGIFSVDPDVRAGDFSHFPS